MTTRGLAVDPLSTLTVHGQRREDGKPNVSNRRVWRRSMSPRLLLSEAPAVATPSAGGATLAALPSAVQDLARFFLNLTGSSSLGAVGSVAGVAAPASGVGVQLCPSAPGGSAVAPCAVTAAPAGLTVPPSALAAVPGMSGRQQRQETSRSGRCHRRSHPAMGPTERRRSVRGVGLLPLVLLLAVGSGPIGRPPSLRRMPTPWLLLPELDVRLEVLPGLVLDLRVGHCGSGALTLGCWSLIPLSFGCGG